MYGQTTVANVGENARMFRIEVEGMRQNGETNKRKFPVRRSGSTFITVSYDRMSDEYKRITRLGGRIVNIQPLDGSESSEAPAAAESEED
ncbi:phycobilisome linker polypeptide [Spirulina subsalsa FACHB-351]|uniref:Phycobilisome linker polypeptide n=1 Tax=Spirulina subsalsa FACHB-351 TaxID=234711 RepID=A0ABT3L4M4_9CYAN|nr:phycobilisome linker polypeptide [Spirulina subsalsa]MCW6036407.1 phycobilisome linker polypeptide [Spirulina subsalsa FACHB-351]